jgi:hypothetical protein
MGERSLDPRDQKGDTYTSDLVVRPFPIDGLCGVFGGGAVVTYSRCVRRWRACQASYVPETGRGGAL